MKKQVLGVILGTVAMALTAGDAAAVSTLNITGWSMPGGSAPVTVWTGTGTVNATYGVGSFAANLNGVTLTEPIYCLDIFHSFGFGATWNVNPIIVPPDPPNPPPFNTAEASWIYHKYGKTASDAIESGGVQIALWEVSHDQGWRTQYGIDSTDGDLSTNWSTTGFFKYNAGITTSGPSPASSGSQADAILADLYANYTEAEAGHSTYYEPAPQPNGSLYGQGQIGGIVVPEPGTVLLLGAGLLTIVGLISRKRS